MDELIKLDPMAIKRIEWIAERDNFIELLGRFETVDSEDVLKASGALQTAASKHLKELEKIRKEVKQPAIDFGRKVDAQAKLMRAALEAQIARIKKLNGDYATRVAKEAEAERQRIAAAEAERIAKEQEQQSTTTFGGLEVSLETQPTELVPVAPLPTGKVNTGANAMVTVWEFEIVNPKLVPAEFLVVDERKVREFMNYKVKMGETPELPGVAFRSRVDVRSR